MQPDSSRSSDLAPVRDALAEATLTELGGERLDGSGFEDETPDEFTAADAAEEKRS
jgi:hypothetical protein